MPELHCQRGNHKWERPAQRGRKPHNCPLHQDVDAAREVKPGERFSEEEKIEEFLMERTLEGSEKGQPTAAALTQALEKQGFSDGIIESARHLPVEQYDRLQERCAQYPAEPRKVRHR